MTRRRRHHLYLLPNFFTGLNLFLGLWAIMLTIDGVRLEMGGSQDARLAIVIAATWIIIANLMDGIDGAVARMTKTTSRFGVQFDSMSDLVTFGIAPAVVLYATIFPLHPQAATGIAATFAMCGAVRLARFNIDASATSKKRVYQGLPIPAAAGVTMAYVLCWDEIAAWVGADMTGRVLAILTLIAAYLMISKTRFQAFRSCVFPTVETPVSIAVRILALSIFIYWIFFSWEVLALLIFGGYVVYGLTDSVVWRLRLIRRPWERGDESRG